MNDLQQTYIDGSASATRADFNKVDFDRLVSEKGRDVIVEKAIQCPCRGEYTNHRSTCRNCGGVGWIFVNPFETRMILSGIDVSTKYAPWSEESRGKVAITAMVEEELSYMDRITAKDASSVYSEALYLSKFGNKLFTYCSYDIKELLYAGLYVDDNTPLVKLNDAQYTFRNNIFELVDGVSDEDNVSIALRYKHAPTFHIFEFRRETIQSYRLENKVEVQQDLPISAFASRAHYAMKAVNTTNNWLLDNNY